MRACIRACVCLCVCSRAASQLYAAKFDAAMKTAIRLAEFEDILPPRDVYSLIALTAYHNKVTLERTLRAVYVCVCVNHAPTRPTVRAR